MNDLNRVETDPWLSRMLGFPCFSWSGHASQFPTEEWLSLTGTEREWMLTAYPPRGLSDEDAIALPGSPILCDTRLTFRFSPPTASISQLGALPALRVDDAVIRTLRADDAKAVYDLAGRAFRYSRFHADPRIPGRTADLIKSEWARNLALGVRGAGGWIVEKSGVVAGFLGVARGRSEDPQSEHLAVDLVGVAPEFSGQGLGTALLGTAVEEAHALGVELIASTQATNVAARKLYLRMGLKQEPTRTWIIHCRPQGYAIGADDSMAPLVSG